MVNISKVAVLIMTVWVTSLETLIKLWKYQPVNLKQIPPEFEVQIYQFFIQLVKDDMDKRTAVGKKMFEPVFSARLTAITEG